MRKMVPWGTCTALATSALLLSFSCGDGESTLVSSTKSRADAGGQAGAAEAAGGPGAAGVGGGDIGPSEPTCEPASGELGDLKLTPVLTDVREAVLALAPLRDTRHLFVVQRTGRVLLIEDGELLPEPFLELDVQATYAEKGLLGMAFHPNYEDNGLFYLYYISAEEVEGDVVVAEFERDPADPNRALPAARRELIRLVQPTAKHKAGMLLFDAEGRLYISVGNGGDTTVSEDPGSPYGKVLRIDPSPDSETYSIPRDNPLKTGWAPEVLEYGLRNPWRISLDPCTNDLYMADVGSEDFEEINISPAGKHGYDYGYVQMEGHSCQPNVAVCDPEGKTLPSGGYVHADRNCAIIGGFVYRGHAIPELRGAYLYADLCSGRIFLLRYEDGEVQDEREITEMINPDRITGFTSFGTDAAGELYLMSRHEETIYRIDAE